MRIGILGTGDVGKALANAFIALGHDVKMGSRDANNEKAAAWAKEKGAKASHGTFADAARFGELNVLATLGSANEAALQQALVESFAGKIVFDTTNPLDFSKGFPPSLSVSGADSAGERVQRLLPTAKVVKVFNTVGSPLMFKPQFAGGPPTMFIAGNDKGAKATTAELLKQFGWETLDAGGIESSRYLEAMCLIWVLTAAPSSWNQAFKMLRK